MSKIYYIPVVVQAVGTIKIEVSESTTLGGAISGMLKDKFEPDTLQDAVVVEIIWDQIPELNPEVTLKETEDLMLSFTPEDL